ncbi:MAG: DUF2807 domain-containing protein [Saprospiraceae bacterium]|nr:DUF2807 domain-containing protein [Saprospiraceae bacterium]
MKVILLPLLAVFLIAANAIAQNTRQLSNFSEVSAATGVKVILVKSNETKARLDLENCEPDDIITEVKGDRLQVKFANSRSWNHKRNRKATITVYYKDIDAVSVSSGAVVNAENIISAQELRLDGSSGGTLDLEVSAQSLEAEASSGGILQLHGNTEVLDINVSSGGIFRSYDLASDEADVGASSGGVASFSVRNRLDANASSGGVIKYRGNPEKIHTNTSSAGHISSKE